MRGESRGICVPVRFWRGGTCELAGLGFPEGRQFPQIPSQAIIIPSFTDNPLPAYRVAEFKFNRDSPQVVKRSVVDAMIPAWAKTGVAAMLNKIAA